MIVRRQPYGDLVRLNTSRFIADSVGPDVLAQLAGDYLELLDSSTAIYEANGDYALGLFASAWCRTLDHASRGLCGTGDDREALSCGKWHCHEASWGAARRAMETGRPVDVECPGGIRLHALPIFAGHRTIGGIALGYGDPPGDVERLGRVAERYGLDVGQLRGLAESHGSRPAAIVEIAKKRLATTARLIGEIVSRKEVEREHARLLDRERDYSRKLRGLTEAAVAINAAPTVEDVLRVVTDRARGIIGARRAAASLTDGEGRSRASDTAPAPGELAVRRPDGGQIGGPGPAPPLRRTTGPIRLSRADLEARPAWPAPGTSAGGHRPDRGYLAAPLVGRDGVALGLIELSDKDEGEFDADDEAILVQLTQVASVAIENVYLLGQVRASYARAEAASQAKDHFLAALSHELRTPLTPVLMTVSALDSDPRLPEELRGEVAMARRNVEMEARLIDDLLDLTRITQGKLELQSGPVDIHLKARNAVDVCKADLRSKGLCLGLELGATRHRVVGDAARLQQVLWNVVKNAVKFTPEGGRVTIATRDADGDRLVIEVSDTGAGIPPDALPRIFDAFEQGGRGVTQRFGGLGLGLAITRALVEAHGGTIAASSEGEGRGATFTIELPGAEPAGVAGIATPRSVGRVAIRPLRILLVEDHPDTARITARLLAREGHAVTTASSVASALEAASGAFDLMISDMGLPDGSGLDLMRRLAPLPGIAMSGYGMRADIERSREAGFAEHLTKPVDFDVLEEAIRRVIGPDGGPRRGT